MRPVVDIVIPIQKHTEQLDKVVELLEANTEHFRLHLVNEPSLNVSDARQKALDELVEGHLVCFLDDDSEMIQPGWLEPMIKTLQAREDAGAVFGGEWWGTEPQVELAPGEDVEIEYGPAACMLLDRRRIPSDVIWDGEIGLRSGWLGGDFEEVDYCYQLRHAGLRLYRSTGSVFHHTGGKTTLIDFLKTDRHKTTRIMTTLLAYKYAKAPEDKDFFKGLKYVKAHDNNDCMLAPDQSLRDCYRKVIHKNGLQYIRSFNRLGLV